MAGRTAEDSPHALLVRDFANTVDREDGVDVEHLATGAELARWLVGNGLVSGRPRADRSDLALAHRLRAGLRSALVEHDTGHEHDPAQAPPDVCLSDPLPVQLTRELPLQLAIVDGQPQLVPVVGGVRGGLAALLVEVQRSVSDGSWERLKICAADDCWWAFLDQSKNRSRAWCDMGSCGNRAKTRTYRARHKGHPTADDG